MFSYKKPIHWREARQADDITPSWGTIYDYLSADNYIDGYIFPVSMGAYNYGLICFSAVNRIFDKPPLQIELLRVVCDCLNRRSNIILGNTETAAISLSKREMSTMDLIIEGYSNKEIAESLNISRHTVDRHLRNIFRKLDVHNRVQAAIKYTRY